MCSTTYSFKKVRDYNILSILSIIKLQVSCVDKEVDKFQLRSSEVISQWIKVNARYVSCEILIVRANNLGSSLIPLPETFIITICFALYEFPLLFCPLLSEKLRESVTIAVNMGLLWNTRKHRSWLEIKEGEKTIPILPVLAFGAPEMKRALTRSVSWTTAMCAKLKFSERNFDNPPKAFPAHSLLKFHPYFPTRFTQECSYWFIN